MNALGFRQGTFHAAAAAADQPPDPAGTTFRALTGEDLQAQPLIAGRGRSSRFAQRADEGHAPFGFLDAGGDLVAYFWLAAPDRGRLTAPWAFPDLRFLVPPGHAYVWDCHTAEAWRGRGLYRAGLRHLRRRAASRGAATVVIAHEQGNAAAARGIAAAGFTPAFGYAVARLGPWCVVRAGSEPWRLHAIADVARLPALPGPARVPARGVGT